MRQCSEKAFAMCPSRHLCGSIEDATFADHSECAAFNKQVEDKPMTNGDRIRAMSDEELAELIVKHNPMHAWNKQVREIYFSFDDHRKDNPQRAWIEWLQQPAEKQKEDT